MIDFTGTGRIRIVYETTTNYMLISDIARQSVEGTVREAGMAFFQS